MIQGRVLIWVKARLFALTPHMDLRRFKAGVWRAP